MQCVADGGRLMPRLVGRYLGLLRLPLRPGFDLDTVVLNHVRLAVLCFCIYPSSLVMLAA